MDKKLCIFICNSLIVEATHIIKELNFHDVVLKTYPTNCASNSLDVEFAIKNAHINQDEFSKILFFVSSCFKKKKTDLIVNNKIDFYFLDQCFELLTSKEIVQHFINQGCYVVTNGWLVNYKKHINQWGFDENTSKVFFGESIKKILFLDTGLKWDYKPSICKLSDYMGLPWEIFPIGLTYYRNFLIKIISEWRIERQNKSINEKLALVSRENADYLLIFFLLNKLVNYTDERLIIKEIFNLLNMLFSPQNIVYYQFENNKNSEKQLFNNNYEVLNEEEDILYKINYLNEDLGIFKIYEVKFPEYIEKYKKMGAIISQISSMAIANARKFEIVENQKQLLEENSKYLLEANQSKDKFFSIIAHDLRSPFNSFLGLTKIMSDDIQSLTMMQLQNIAIRMERSATNLFDLLENLLQWARMQQGILPFIQVVYTLKPELYKIIELMYDIAKSKEIEITSDIEIDVCIKVDINMFNAVIRNLISNAIKFTNKNGKIHISTQITDTHFVEIKISDNGIGMEAEVLNKLFKIDGNIGRKGTNGEPSTGLGLLLCKDFVEKNGGTIRAESKEDIGSSFYVSLPIRSKD